MEMKFNEVFRTWMAMQDYTRSGAARRLSVSFDSVNNYLSGRSQPVAKKKQIILHIINQDISSFKERHLKNWTNLKSDK